MALLGARVDLDQALEARLARARSAAPRQWTSPPEGPVSCRSTAKTSKCSSRLAEEEPAERHVAARAGDHELVVVADQAPAEQRRQPVAVGVAADLDDRGRGVVDAALAPVGAAARGGSARRPRGRARTGRRGARRRRSRRAARSYSRRRSSAPRSPIASVWAYCALPAGARSRRRSGTGRRSAARAARRGRRRRSRRRRSPPRACGGRAAGGAGSSARRARVCSLRGLLERAEDHAARRRAPASSSTCTTEASRCTSTPALRCAVEDRRQRRVGRVGARRERVEVERPRTRSARSPSAASAAARARRRRRGARSRSTASGAPPAPRPPSAWLSVGLAARARPCAAQASRSGTGGDLLADRVVALALEPLDELVAAAHARSRPSIMTCTNSGLT